MLDNYIYVKIYEDKMRSSNTFINIKAVRGHTIQEIEFPEEYSTWNRLRWYIVGLVMPIEVSWFK